MDENDFEKIRSLYEKGEDEPLPGHSFENHVLEVYENMRELVSEEDVDKEVMEYATLLHDIGRCYEREKGHAEVGAERAREFLVEELNRSEDFAEKVAECIRFHSNRPHLEPPTREAEILWTADKMHALGATGLCRFLLSLGAKNCSCDEAVEVLKQRVSDAEKRLKEFGFQELIEGLDPIKNFIRKYKEENYASN